MKKRLTEKDVWLLTMVRHRLLSQMRVNNPPRREHVPIPTGPGPVFECSHGEPWTECTICSKRKTP